MQCRMSCCVPGPSHSPKLDSQATPANEQSLAEAGRASVKSKESIPIGSYYVVSRTNLVNI
jgi:hypothetical protein